MGKKELSQDHRSLAFWAADCAEHVLPYFEKECPDDDRPRKAIEIGRDWARSGLPMKMNVIRGASLAAHAAAREAEKDSPARFAARAAGQAVATAHVSQHAYGASYYAFKAIMAAYPADAESKITNEFDWESQHLPESLRRGLLEFWRSKRIPKNLRRMMAKIMKRKQKAIAVYPKNKAHFLRLLQFGKEIVSICKEHDCTPVLFGSMAHFLHTGDNRMKVNDLDFLVPRSIMEPVFRKLKREGAEEFIWKIGTTHTPDLMREARRMKGKTLLVRFPKWDGIVVVRNDLRVELDAMDRTYKDTIWHKRLPKDFVDLNIDDVRLKMISLKSMKQLYEIAHMRSRYDKPKILKKMKRLDIFLRTG